MTRHRAYVMENLDTGQAVCAGVSRVAQGMLKYRDPQSSSLRASSPIFARPVSLAQTGELARRLSIELIGTLPRL